MNEAISLGLSPSALLSIAGSGVLERLRSQYLPELQSLHKECVWLRSNLDLDKEREIQDNEKKLLKFVGMLEIVISKINEVTVNDLQSESNVKGLLTLEINIVRTILPVRSRLHEKWASFQKEKENGPKTQTTNPKDLKKPKAKKNTRKPVETMPNSLNPIHLDNSNLNLMKSHILPTEKKTSRKSNKKPTIEPKTQLIPQGPFKYSLERVQNPISGVTNGHLEPPSNNMNKHSYTDTGGPMPPPTTQINQQPTRIEFNQSNDELFNQSYSSLQTADQYSWNQPMAVESGNTPSELQHDHQLQHQQNLNEWDSLSEQEMLGGNLGGFYDDTATFGMDPVNQIYPYPTSTSSATSTSTSTFNFNNEATRNKKRSYTEELPNYVTDNSEGCENLEESSLSSSLTTPMGDQNRARRRISIREVPTPRKPREAKYNCSLCKASYSVLVADNPWWAVYTHECPSCKRTQIPRIDISLETNAIELDPNISALYEEWGESGDDSDGEDSLSLLGGERSSEDLGSKGSMAGVEKTAQWGIPTGDGGGQGSLPQEEASKLFVLMCHCRNCNGEHESQEHEAVCRSTKFLMLHVRDCEGFNAQGQECLFPWCRLCKKMLIHITGCVDPGKCTICNPWCLSQSYFQFQGLNKNQTAAN